MIRQLSDPQIQMGLRILLISEAGGVETFSAAERTASSKVEREMWSALRALEVKTRAAVYDNLGEIAERFDRSRRAAEILGRASGSTLALLPHNLQCQTLIVGTKAFLPTFRKLHHYFRETRLEAFFDFVVRHEQAIADVGYRGLHGAPSRLGAVEALLECGGDLTLNACETPPEPT